MATHGQQQFILNEKLFSRKDAKAQRKDKLQKNSWP
jgi:hypothetical protein